MPRTAFLLLTVLAACASSPAVPATGSAPPAPSHAAEAFVPPSPPTLRLPPIARPIRYDLQLWLDPRAETFHGQVSVELEILASTRVVWLNATDLAIDQATLVGGATSTPSPVRVVPGGDDFVGFVPDADLAPGKARLTLTYHGKVDQTRSRGIYAVREGDGEPYLYTFFEAMDARRSFPCFDEPGYKVPWKLTFHVPAGDVALGNAPVVAERAEDGGKVVELAESKPLPTYLVAFIVGPFDLVDAGVAGHFSTPLRFAVPRGRGGETGYAASVTPRIVGLLEDYFGMPYPYGKLDVAVVPRYWGTMEHPGLLAMGQSLTLIKPAESSVDRQLEYANIAAHELAHYWFGDYVTAAWWDDLWLNEAMGTWMDAKITDSLEPTWHFDLERSDRASMGMRGDSLTDAKKIRQRADSKTDIQTSADNDITYFKGQSVLAMFEAWMTPERFQRAIRAYMSAHAFGNATAEDLFSALDAETSGAGAALATFVDQPGVPAITVETVCQGGRREIALRQHRYRPIGVHTADETWKVPVCVHYGTGDGKAKGRSGRACTLLETESATIPIETTDCPAWVVGDADGRGYYHVVYTERALRAALATSSGITLAERASLLGDAAALVASGELALSDALARVPDTAANRARHIVLAGIRLLGLARDAAMSDAEATRRTRFLRTVYGPGARRLGLVRRPDDGVDDALLRPTIIAAAAVQGDDGQLRRQAHDLALAWLRDPVALDPELAGVLDSVLAAAATTGDESLFSALLARARTETDHAKVGRLLAALGAFPSPQLARRADAVILDAAFDIRDSIQILRTQFGARATRELAWTFLKETFDALSSRMRSDEVGWNVVELTKVFCDDDHAADVKSFFEPRAARFDGLAHAVASAAEGIAQCAAAFKKNQPGLDAFLARY